MAGALCAKHGWLPWTITIKGLQQILFHYYIQPRILHNKTKTETSLEPQHDCKYDLFANHVKTVLLLQKRLLRHIIITFLLQSTAAVTLFTVEIPRIVGSEKRHWGWLMTIVNGVKRLQIWWTILPSLLMLASNALLHLHHSP